MPSDGERPGAPDTTTTFLFDLDGTLYRDGRPIAGAVGMVNALAASGYRVLYATNDASLTCEQHCVRLRGLGFPVADGSLLTAGGLTAQWLAERPRPVGSVMVLGPDALAEEIVRRCPAAALTSSATAEAVVVGLARDVSYAKLTGAFRAVESGALLLAPNADRSFPGPDGRLLPGAGAIVAAVEAASGRRARVLGKPAPDLYARLLADHGADHDRTVVIGDSLATDIAAARRLSLYSALVLTGVTRTAPTCDGRLPAPDLVMPSLENLLPLIRASRPDLVL